MPINFGAADNLFATNFEKLISQGNIVAAACIMASLGNALHMPITITCF